MLGKAVYEGLVIDVPFSHFFMNAMLGISNSLNELPTLDADLSKNLRFVKNYTGNMEDLGLCFAVDESAFGQVTSRPLIPGGTAINVTTVIHSSHEQEIGAPKYVGFPLFILPVFLSLCRKTAFCIAT
jgi:hypothetical protein